MQQWEYMFIEIAFTEQESTDYWKVKHVNGREVQDWKKKVPAHSYVDSLGQQGWELVGVVPRNTNSHNNPILIFKRPKA